MGHSLALAKIDQITLTTSWEANIPEDVIKTSLREKQTQNRKLNLNGPGIIPQPLSGGRFNFVISGIVEGDFEVDIFNITGSRVWSHYKKGATESDYQFMWDGANSQLKPVRSGVYVAKIRTGNASKEIMMTLNR
jgi:hypothetical protein